MNQKGFVNIILAVVVVAIVAVGGYFVFSKKSETLPKQPTPMPITKDIDIAKQAIITYFNLLKTKQYSAAVAYHGSGYETLQNWNPDVNPNDHVALLEGGCKWNGWQCLKIKNVLTEQQITQSEFKFTVQFEKPEWSTGNEAVFTLGPCCGMEDTGQRTTDFEYTIRKVNGNFIVMNPPVYVP